MKETSKQAYEQIKPDLNRQQRILLRVLTFWLTPCNGYIPTTTGYTSEELSKLPGCELSYEQIRKRMGELEKLGLVKDSGKRGKTSSGRNAIVWEIG